MKKPRKAAISLVFCYISVLLDVQKVSKSVNNIRFCDVKIDVKRAKSDANDSKMMSEMMSKMMSKTQLFLYTSWYRLAFLPYSTNLSPFLIFLLQCFLQFGIVQMYLPSWESVPYVRILN